MAQPDKKIMEEPAEQVAPKSARDTYREGFAADYPDVDMDDEEAFYGQLNSNRDKYKKTQADFNAMNEMMAQNPNAGYFMHDLFSGKSEDELTASFLENFGDVFSSALNDPSEESAAKFAEALKKHGQRIKENEDFQQQWAENDEASRQTIEQYKTDNGLDDAAMKNLEDTLKMMVAKFASGIIDKEMLDAVSKIQNYDNDMAAAEERGAAQGRNTRIRENLRKSQGDGIPMMQGGGNSNSEPKKKEQSIFDFAKRAR